MIFGFNRDARIWLEGLGVDFEERQHADDMELDGVGPFGRVRVCSYEAASHVVLGEAQEALGLVRITLDEPSGPPSDVIAEWWKDGPLAIYGVHANGVTAVLHDPSEWSLSLEGLDGKRDDGFGEPTFIGRLDGLARQPEAKRAGQLQRLGQSAIDRASKDTSLAQRSGGIVGGGVAGALGLGYCALPLLGLGVIPVAAAAAIGAVAGAVGGGYAAARIGEARAPAWLRAALFAVRQSGLFRTARLDPSRQRIWSGDVLLRGSSRDRGPALFFGGGGIEARSRDGALALRLDTFSLEVSGQPSPHAALLPRRWAAVTLRLPDDQEAGTLGRLRASDQPGVLYASLSEEEAASGALDHDVLEPLRAHLQGRAAGPYR